MGLGLCLGQWPCKARVNVLMLLTREGLVAAAGVVVFQAMVHAKQTQLHVQLTYKFSLSCTQCSYLRFMFFFI